MLATGTPSANVRYGAARVLVVYEAAERRARRGDAQTVDWNDAPVSVEKLTRAEVDRLIDDCQSWRWLNTGVDPEAAEQLVAELLRVGLMQREREEHYDAACGFHAMRRELLKGP